MSEIKPCPRCGSKAFVTIQFGVMCEVDRCLHLPPRENREQAIAAWNTRAEVADLTASLNRASDACASVQKERDELREMLGEALAWFERVRPATDEATDYLNDDGWDDMADLHDRLVAFLARYEGGRN